MSDRIFRSFMKLLPAEFRGDYGREMEAAFRDERREASSFGALASLWIQAILDVLRTAPSEHWDILKRDSWFAIRSALARPAHTLTAVITLALGLGASLVMFAVVDGVLLAPLPYRDPAGIVSVQETSKGGAGSNLGYLTMVDIEQRARSLTAIAGVTQGFPTLSGEGKDAERVGAMRASRGYFDIIGVRPAMGRVFTEAEDQPGVARRVTILSDGLWRRRFDADPKIVGRQIELSGVPYVVVGVMPQGFTDLYGRMRFNGGELWTPLGYDPADSFACRTCRHVQVVGRLAPGASVESATRELNGLMAALSREHPGDYADPGTHLVPMRDLLLGPVRDILSVLSFAVLVLLLVACFTVANLLLLRASDRAREIAVRSALGVSPGRMARQLITESLLLAFAGGLAGLFPAIAVIRWLAIAGPAQLPRLDHISLDGRALFAGLGLVIGSGVLFGLAPMRQWLSRDLAVNLHGAGRTTSGSWRLRAALVTANVALAAVLLVGSGLLSRSLMGLLAVSPGIDPTNALTFQVTLAGPAYVDPDRAKAIAKVGSYYDRLLERVRAVPGVTAAGGVTTLPLGGEVDGYGLHLASRPLDNPSSAPSADRFAVTPGYFAATGTELRRGRLLDARDSQSAPKVAVVNETLVRRMFPNADPIGQELMLGPADADRRAIVGIVEDVTHQGLDSVPGMQVYVPQSQWAWAEDTLSIVVRGSRSPSGLVEPIRKVMREIDSKRPMSAVRNYEDIVAASTGTRRLTVALLVFFAAAALALAIVGLYGAVGVLVGQQQREIGVRLVLGARVEEIRLMVLSRGLRPVALGLAGGLATAAFVASVLESMLFGITALDPATFMAAFGVLGFTALAACAIPAWRASRTDPATTLRAE
jgi:putative ABC transport system permease protein